MMQEIHAIVHGKVQGVCFRAWTRKTAQKQGVTGWVRNLDSGDVETVAQADKDVLDNFLARLHDGPLLARVTGIDVTWRTPEHEHHGFEVRM